MSTPDLFLGIDPGPFGTRHGWAVLRYLPGLTPQWTASGQGTTEQILAQLRGVSASIACVAVETPAGYVWSFERGSSLLQTARAAGHLQGLLEGLGLRVATPAAQDWRRHVIGNPQAGDPDVARALARLLSGLPTRSSVHERDAAGAALAVAKGWRPVPEQIRLAQIEGKRRTKAAKRKAGK